MRIIGRYIAYLFCFMLSSVTGVNAQEYFNVRFDNPFLSNGSGVGLSIFYGDTTYCFGNIVDSDLETIGYQLKLNATFEFIDTIKIDSPIDTFSVNLARFGGVCRKSNHEFILALSEYQNPTSLDDIDEIVSYDHNMNVNWSESIGDTLPIITYQTRPAHDGGYLICGLAANEDGGTTQFGPHGLILKTDSLGHQLWERQINNIHRFEFMAPADDGDIFLSGAIDRNNPPDDFADVSILKCDSLGNEIWRMVFGGDGTHSHNPLHLISTDTILTVGTGGFNIMFPNYQEDQFIFRIVKDEGSDYSLLDEALYPVHIYGYGKWPTSLVEVEDGYVAGGSMLFELDPFPFYPYGFLFKVDHNLDSLWLRGYRHFVNQGGWHYIRDVDVTPDGGFVTTGVAKVGFGDTIAGPAEKIWLMRLDSMGCVEPGCHLIDGLTDIVTGLSNSMSVFPNPASDVATLRFKLPAQYIPEKSRLEIYDLQGRKVEVITLPKFHNGFEKEIDVSNFSSGMYTIHWLSGGSWYDSVKLIIDE